MALSEYTPTLLGSPGAQARYKVDTTPDTSGSQVAAGMASLGKGLASAIGGVVQSHNLQVGAQQGSADLGAVISSLGVPSEHAANLARAISPPQQQSDQSQGMSPVGPPTGVPLQALAPQESAQPPPMSVGPTPMPPLNLTPENHPRYGGELTVGDQTFNYASGGAGRGSSPPGDRTIMDYRAGPLGGGEGRFETSNVFDPQIGATRGLIQIHAGRTNDLDQLYSAGCFAIPPAQWPAVKSALMQEMNNSGGQLTLHIGNDGFASVVRPGETADQAQDRAQDAANSGVPSAPMAARAPMPAADTSGLPAGLRNNNPLNIKYIGQPGTMPSANTDQGDPQAVYPSLQAGWNAAGDLALRKYSGGKTTPDQIIAGQGGWTPGNHEAAANVARTMSISPDADLNLNDQARRDAFLRALVLQEQGPKGAQYVAQNLNFPLARAVAPGGAPGFITPGQRQLSQAVNGPGLYPQTAALGMSDVGTIPPARAALSNSPFMQPPQEQPPSPPLPSSPPAPPPEIGPQGTGAPPNQVAQNLYGQSYASDVPLMAQAQAAPAASEEAPKVPAAVPVPEATSLSAPQQPRIDVQAAMRILADPRMAQNPAYAPYRQQIMQLVQGQIAADRAEQQRIAGEQRAHQWQMETEQRKLTLPPQEIKAGAYVYNPQTKKYEQPVPEEPTGKPLTDEDYANYHITPGAPYVMEDGVPKYVGPPPGIAGHSHVISPGGTLVDESGKVLYKGSGADATLSPDAVETLATRAVLGDHSGLVGMGRGTQGSANLVAVQNKAAEIAAAKGIDPQGIIDNIAEVGGQKSGMRTAGNIGAKLDIYGTSAANALDNALVRSSELPRGQFMPLNQLRQAAQKMDSNAPLAVLNAATETAVNEYTRAVGLSGVATDAAKQHAYDMLNAAQSPDAYAAVVKQLKWEVENLHNAARGVSTGLRKGTGGPEATPPLPIPPGPGAQPAAPPANPAAAGPLPLPTPGMIRNGYQFKGGNPADRNSWQPVQ